MANVLAPAFDKTKGLVANRFNVLHLLFPYSKQPIHQQSCKQNQTLVPTITRRNLQRLDLRDENVNKIGGARGRRTKLAKNI
jgi:hypothetical protein